MANPSKVNGKRRRKKRNDRTDAQFLGRQGRADITLLYRSGTAAPGHRSTWNSFCTQIRTFRLFSEAPLRTAVISVIRQAAHRAR